MPKIKNITGIILSGGKSTRMGTNKSFLKLGNKTVIEHMTDLMKSIFDDVIISTNEPEKYEFLKLPSFEDIYKNIGPLAGIHSGLVHSKTDKNFIISCDIPLMSENMINHIITFSENYALTVPEENGRLQYMAAVYHKSLIEVIENIINEENSKPKENNYKKNKKLSIHQLLDIASVRIINNIENSKAYEKNLFLNMNKPHDYEKILSIYFNCNKY